MGEQLLIKGRYREALCFFTKSVKGVGRREGARQEQTFSSRLGRTLCLLNLGRERVALKELQSLREEAALGGDK